MGAKFPIAPLRKVFASQMFMPSTLTATERRMTGRDEFGDAIWETVDVVDSRCLLRPMSGSEEVVAGGLQANVNAAIDYPVNVKLSPAMTVSVDGVSFNVSYIAPGSEAHMSEQTALVSRTG